MNYCSGLKGRVLFDEPLSKHTSFKIGPKACLWAEPYDVEDLKSLLRQVRLNKINYLIIGSGSNLLIKKEEIPLAIHFGSPNFKKISVKGNEVEIGAGVTLSHLITAVCKNDLGGMEFLSGIPGCLGGALIMNAGTSWPVSKTIGDFVKSVEVLDKNGNVRILKGRDLKFAYRHSNLSEFIVSRVKLRLEKKPRLETRREIKLFLDYRCRTQDLNSPSAGCIFKNPANNSAGRLIDLCGLKGMRIGDAVVSTKHANFIVNRNKATAKDVLSLIKFIREQVKQKFGLWLETEIKII